MELFLVGGEKGGRHAATWDGVGRAPGLSRSLVCGFVGLCVSEFGLVGYTCVYVKRWSDRHTTCTEYLCTLYW
jgi:hypothetical protein